MYTATRQDAETLAHRLNTLPFVDQKAAVNFTPQDVVVFQGILEASYAATSHEVAGFPVKPPRFTMRQEGVYTIARYNGGFFVAQSGVMESIASHFPESRYNGSVLSFEVEPFNWSPQEQGGHWRARTMLRSNTPILLLDLVGKALEPR